MDGTAGGVQRHQHIGVAAAVLIVQAADQDSEKVLLTLPRVRPGLGRVQLLAFVLVWDGVLLSLLTGRRRRVLLHRGRLGKAFIQPCQGDKHE